MPFQLIPPDKAESGLFYRLDGETAERHGALGYMRADFGCSGMEFWNSWFDTQKHLKTPDFKNEFNAVIESLRNDGENPVFACRGNLVKFCAENAGHHLPGGAKGFKIRTLDYTYTFHCAPGLGDYDIRVYAYDNRYLLPELEGKHKLPNDCFGILPSSGELIFIVLGEKGYYPSGKSTNDPEMNRQIETAGNALLGVTRQQAEAMLAGSLFGWDKPAAKPWKYDMNGNPRLPLPKKDAPER